MDISCAPSYCHDLHFGQIKVFKLYQSWWRISISLKQRYFSFRSRSSSLLDGHDTGIM